jgi:cellulose synthase/poly-beta-1,6-N-acetylglucosamine synthase-like glycosyltransferase
MEPISETLVYIFIFCALFFEVFALLTFFDRRARARRDIAPSGAALPGVSLIVPCYNEEHTIQGSIESLLALDYPRELLSIIVVNDGSKDGSAQVLEAYANHPQVSVLSKKNGGKHTALNLGIERATTELVGCLDADSFVASDALKEIVGHFDEPRVGAVTASLSINAPRSWIERMQQAEYLMGIVFRHILATLNGLYVAPGPFTIYRKSMFAEIGGFRPAHDTEDMEIALRMQREGWRLENAPRARVYTTAPRTVRALVKQRTRWTTGFIRNGFDYRDLFVNPAHGVLGLMVLPLNALMIFFGIAAFGITLINFVMASADFIARASGVPIAYTLTPRGVDLFFAPVSAIAVIGIVSFIVMTATIYLGANISKTKPKLGAGILWYALCYSFIAPLWLMQAVADTAFGVRRSWR